MDRRGTTPEWAETVLVGDAAGEADERHDIRRTRARRPATVRPRAVGGARDIRRRTGVAWWKHRSARTMRCAGAAPASRSRSTPCGGRSPVSTPTRSGNGSTPRSTLARRSDGPNWDSTSPRPVAQTRRSHSHTGLRLVHAVPPPSGSAAPSLARPQPFAYGPTSRPGGAAMHRFMAACTRGTPA